MPAKLRRSPIQHEMLLRVYNSDQDIYPAGLPFHRLKNWVTACPQLAVCLEHCNGNDEAEYVPVGVIIALPILSSYWNDLVCGKLREIDIDADPMIAKDYGEVGIHIFHIEKFEAFTHAGSKRRFTDMALESIQEVLENESWSILGYSGPSNPWMFVTTETG